MALYKDTCRIVQKEVPTKEFYRFEGAKTCSKLKLGRPNHCGYIYVSNSQDHHMYFTMKRLKQMLGRAYLQETGEELTNQSVRLEKNQPVIKHLVLYSGALEPLFSYQLVCSGAMEQLMKENCIRNDQPKNGKRYVERVDRRVYGGGYGLGDEWKDLFNYLTYFQAGTRITRNDLWDIIREMRKTGKLTHKDHIKGIINDKERYAFAINAHLLDDYNKYNIINALDRILEKGLVLPDSSLATDPRRVTREVVEEYERGREKTLELLGRRY